MPHAFCPHPPDAPLTQSNAAVTAANGLAPEGELHLKQLLAHKLRGIPIAHIPDLTLTDILHASRRTNFLHVPQDIGLAFLLRNRASIDKWGERAKKDELNPPGSDSHSSGLPSSMPTSRGHDENVARSIWFYRLDAVRQFQRWHDGVRWNLALFTALLTQHTLYEDRDKSTRHEHNSDEQGRRARRRDSLHLSLSPAAARFMTLYLSAVLEHHTAHSSSPVFSARESFIRFWGNSAFDLFIIHRSWAKKALQKEMKRLSKQWQIELEYASRELGREEYEDRVGKFVGSVVPGRAEQASAEKKWEGMDGSDDGGGGGGDVVKEEGNELLDALRVPCPGLAQKGDEQRRREDDEEGTMVCDLRTAITCVQQMTPRDMLRVLMRLFPPAEHEI